MNRTSFQQRTGLLALAVASVATVIAVARWSGFADIAMFFADECAHALVVRTMAETGGLTLPPNALMVGSLQFDYPPLFHILNTFTYLTMGPQAFPYVNVALAGLLCALVLWGPGGLWEPAQRASVALVLVGVPLFAMYGVRFYVEMLTALIFFCSWWWFARAIRDHRRLDAMVSGVATGLLVWTKQTGLLVLGFYGLFLLWNVVRKQAESRRTMVWLLGTAIPISIAYLVVAFAKGDNPLVFAFPTRHPELWAAAMKSVQVPREIFLDTLWATYGWLPAALLAAPWVVLATPKRQDYPHGPLVALVALVALIFWFDHRIVERHTLFLLPLVAFLGVDALARLAGPRGALVGFAVILAVSVFHLAMMPNYRVQFNPSRNFVQMSHLIKEQTPPNATILTMWWAETKYYTGRNVIWPAVNLDDPPVELWSARSKDDWYGLLRARGIDYLLVDERYLVQSGLGFSRRTVADTEALSGDGRVRLLGKIGAFRLYHVVAIPPVG